MRSHVTLYLTSLILAFSTACASTPQIRLQPLSVISQPEASYVAVVGTYCDSLAQPAVDTEGGDENVKIEVLTSLMQMDRGSLERLIGWTHGARAWTTGLEEAQAVMAAAKEVKGMQLQAPHLKLNGEQAGSVSIVSQVAYVRDYEVRFEGHSTIADPIIDVAQDGLLLNVTATLGNEPGVVALDLELKIADLQRPFAEQTVGLPGMSAGAMIQLPITAIQTLTTRTELANDECLVLITHGTDDPNAFYVLLVHAQRI